MPFHKTAETTDWQETGDQLRWFEEFKNPKANGLRFADFQSFIFEVFLSHFAKFPATGDVKVKAKHDSAEMECEFSRQQALQLFKTFDMNNDCLIDREEFGSMCSRWLQSVFRPNCALIIVDVQNDFIDGSLALINGPAGQDGAEVVPVINKIIDGWQQHCRTSATIVYTQDWHPPDHIGFHANLHMRKYTLKTDSDEHSDEHSDTTGHQNGGKPVAKPVINGDNNGAAGGHVDKRPTDRNQQRPERVEPPGSSASYIQVGHGSDNKFKYKKFLTSANVFDTVLFEDGRVEQKLWPTHCVQNSWGAQLHPNLKQVPEAIRIRKGTLSHVDAYSAFWDNMHLNETGLRQELIAKKITDLFFCGLALDFCVAASALDSAKSGFVTFVIEDACRGIDEELIRTRKQELSENGVFIVQSDAAIDYLSGQYTLNVDKLDRYLMKTLTFKKAFLQL